jgi:pyruvate-ferredoxin/flavodoxin oxidoreductase
MAALLDKGIAALPGICKATRFDRQGLRAGMGKSQEESKKAVEPGYWPLYRYNPALAAEGKNPLVLESKEPNGTIQEFLSGENRYAQFEKIDPAESKSLRAELEKECLERYLLLKQLSEMPGISVDKKN